MREVTADLHGLRLPSWLDLEDSGFKRGKYRAAEQHMPHQLRLATATILAGAQDGNHLVLHDKTLQHACFKDVAATHSSIVCPRAGMHPKCS